MGVFKRTREHKDGTKVAYWYIRFALNGKIKWESVGEVGEVTKTVAQARFAEVKKNIRLGQHEMLVTDIPVFSDFAKNYFAYVRDVKKNRLIKRTKHALDHFKGFYGGKRLSEITYTTGR